MDRYFVRSSADAPEKGPYTVDALKKSYERQMMKADAIVRAESGTETMTLAKLLEIPTPREAIRSEAAREYAQADMEANVRHQRSEGSTNMALGAVMIVAGLGLTAATYSAASGGGRYVVFTGLIIFGFVRLIRGAAAR